MGLEETCDLDTTVIRVKRLLDVGKTAGQEGNSQRAGAQEGLIPVESEQSMCDLEATLKNCRKLVLLQRKIVRPLFHSGRKWKEHCVKNTTQYRMLVVVF